MAEGLREALREQEERRRLDALLELQRQADARDAERQIAEIQRLQAETERLKLETERLRSGGAAVPTPSPSVKEEDRPGSPATISREVTGTPERLESPNEDHIVCFVPHWCYDVRPLEVPADAVTIMLSGPRGYRFDGVCKVVTSNGTESRNLEGVLPVNFTLNARSLSCEFKKKWGGWDGLHVRAVWNGRSITTAVAREPYGAVSLAWSESQ